MRCGRGVRWSGAHCAQERKGSLAGVGRPKMSQTGGGGQICCSSLPPFSPPINHSGRKFTEHLLCASPGSRPPSPQEHSGGGVGRHREGALSAQRAPPLGCPRVRPLQATGCPGLEPRPTPSETPGCTPRTQNPARTRRWCWGLGLGAGRGVGGGGEGLATASDGYR